MKWHGKLIGAVLGLLLTRRIVGLVVGLVLGHLYDIGLFSGRDTGKAERPAPGEGEGDPYAMLGIDSSASDEQLEQAYRRLMSEYHPDRVASAAPELREIAGRRTGEINQAYDQIKRQRGL